jgi:hypothetical protein
MAHWPSSAGPCGPFCTCCPARHAVGLPLNSNVRQRTRTNAVRPHLNSNAAGRWAFITSQRVRVADTTCCANKFKCAACKHRNAHVLRRSWVALLVQPHILGPALCRQLGPRFGHLYGQPQSRARVLFLRTLRPVWHRPRRHCTVLAGCGFMAMPVSRTVGQCCQDLQRCLTLHSSGPPTAWRTSHHVQGLRPILHMLSGAPRCRGPLNSNVRHPNEHFSASHRFLPPVWQSSAASPTTHARVSGAFLVYRHRGRSSDAS